jgi:putative ABC transport system permease protein
MKAVLPSGTYQTDAQRTTFFREAVARLATLPGVQSASAVSYLPMGGLGSATKFFINDRPQPPAGEWPTGDVRAVSPDYFRTMGIPLLRGRDFSAHDTTDAPAVVIINQTLARTFWPGQNPLGRHLTYSWGKLIPLEVVGVVGDARLVTLSNDEIRPAIYCPQLQQPHNAMTFVVRTAGDPSSLASAARGALRQIDPNQPLSDIEPLETVLADSLARPRLVALLLAIFGGAALLLAAIGIYGVMTYIVTARTQEIGVRVALGASHARVLRLVVGQAMAMAGLGIAIGIAGALALTRLLASLLYGVTPTDPLTFTAVALLLALVAVAASLLPARRAAAVDPMVAMRAE